MIEPRRSASGGKGSFAPVPVNGKVAPIPDLSTLAPEPVVRPKAVIHCWRAILIQASPGDGSNSENADGRAQGGQRIALPLTVRVVGGEN
jgi:hypothetical protein